EMFIGSGQASVARVEHYLAGVVVASAVSCGGTGVERVNDPSTGADASETASADYFKAKCKSDIQDCVAKARDQCNGETTVVHQESHAGGLLADALPGPVTWYTVTFRCGASGEKQAAAAQQDALRAFVLPQCQSDWEGRCGLLADKIEAGATIDAAPLAIESDREPGSPGRVRGARKAYHEEPDSLTE